MKYPEPRVLEKTFMRLVNTLYHFQRLLFIESYRHFRNSCKRRKIFYKTYWSFTNFPFYLHHFFHPWATSLFLKYLVCFIGILNCNVMLLWVLWFLASQWVSIEKWWLISTWIFSREKPHLEDQHVMILYIKGWVRLVNWMREGHFGQPFRMDLMIIWWIHEWECKLYFERGYLTIPKRKFVMLEQVELGDELAWLNWAVLGQ